MSNVDWASPSHRMPHGGCQRCEGTRRAAMELKAWQCGCPERLSTHCKSTREAGSAGRSAGMASGGCSRAEGGAAGPENRRALFSSMHIRPARPDDAERVAALLTELDYPTEPEAARKRIENL